jgi:hypothetical protein
MSSRKEGRWEAEKLRSPSTSVASSTRFLSQETLPNGEFLGSWEAKKKKHDF